MADRPRARRNDGATIAPGASPRKSIALLAAAVALVCVALLVLFGRPPSGPSEPEAPLPAPAATEPLAETPPPPPPKPAAALAPAAEPRAPVAAPAREPEAEREAETSPAVPSGIGLFPPPGSDPIKIGIVVPDDFELPEGYLRHYQVMDDGRDLPPILLFHPDYELLDADGKPIPLPENRVVPPELAPPGLPIQILVVPEPLNEEGQ
jgi:hypothetical protein